MDTTPVEEVRLTPTVVELVPVLVPTLELTPRLLLPLLQAANSTVAASRQYPIVARTMRTFKA